VSVYGRIVSAPQIERGLEVTLRYRLAEYLGEALAQLGYDRYALPDPEDIARVVNVDEYNNRHEVALVVIASRGTDETAKRDGDSYALRWMVEAGVVCDLGDPLKTREAAQVYAAAIGQCLAHHGCAATSDGVTWDQADGEYLLLEGSSTWLVREGYMRPPGQSRDMMMGVAEIAVEVSDARSAYGGPAEPPPLDATGSFRLREPVADGVTGPVEPTVTVSRLPLE
jgi:hypothetical protein